MTATHRPPWLIPAAVVALALGVLVGLGWGPAPMANVPPRSTVDAAPRALPTYAQVEQPAPAAQASPAPLPTGYIVGTEPAPAQLAPVAPQAAPALAAPPVVYSDLVPLAEPTPIDPMACARRGIGACRGERP